MTSLPKLNRTYVENTTCVSIAFAGSRQRSLLKTPLTRLVGRNIGTIVQSVLMRTAANGVLQAADSSIVNAITDSTTT